MAAFQVTYFNAVPRAGIAIAALIAICGAPCSSPGWPPPCSASG